MRRPSRRLSFRGAYTFANRMDDASAFLATDGDDNTPQDSRNLAAEWGPSDYDVRHRLVVPGMYDRRAARLAPLRNWQFGAVLAAQSGRPFTPRVSFDNSNTGNVGGGTFAYDRPNVVTGSRRPARARCPMAGRPSSIAPQYTFGNAGRNSLTGPGYVTLDAMVGGAAARRPPRADAAARSLQRAEPDEPSAARQLRRSRDVRPQPVGLPAAPDPARRAIRV